MGKVTREDDKRLGPRKLCKRGHDHWYTTKSGRRKCRTCERLREAVRRAEGRDYKTLRYNATAERCKKGHKNWIISKTGYRQCKSCMRDTSEEWRVGSKKKEREEDEKKEQQRILKEIAELKAKRHLDRNPSRRAHHKGRRDA